MDGSKLGELSYLSEQFSSAQENFDPVQLSSAKFFMGQAQLSSAQRKFCKFTTLHSAERILEFVLGLGRRRRRHVQQNQIREYEDSAAAADDCAIQNDQTRARIVEQAESETIFAFEEFSFENVGRWTELARIYSEGDSHAANAHDDRRRSWK